MGFFTLISFFKSLPFFLLAFVIANSLGSEDFPSVQHPQCIHEHFSALLQLKAGFQYFHREGNYFFYSNTNLSSWSPENRDCCSWKGITCDRSTGHVTRLHLSELHIYGKINLESLCRIQSLRILNLAYNEFDQTPFPSAIGNLTSLTHLNLSHIMFYGQIPLEMSRLTRLVSLDLSFNGYYDYDDHHNLIPLKVEGIGTLVQNMSSLAELYLDYVDISAEGSQWGQVISSALPSLRKLSLYHCNLSGTLRPSWLTNLTKLEHLDLSDNYLSGTIPSSLFTLPSLRTLILGGNQLGGQLSEFHNSSSSLLEIIALGDNQLQRMIPRSIFKLRNLNLLDLSSNNFNSVLDLHLLKNLKNLSYLDLSINELEGSLPIPPPSITAFVFSFNRLSGEIPMSICNASSINTFDISGNNFSGPIPQCIGKMSNALIKEDCSLENLDLSGNQLEGKLPISLANCKHLTILNLGNNQIQDTFPSWVHGFTDLRVFILRSNNFYGPIEPPPTCHNFSKLQIVDLSSNHFNGTLPPAMFCRWKKMTGEDSSDPEYLTTWAKHYFYHYEMVTIRSKGSEINLTVISTAYTIFDLSRNQFQGKIPESIGTLKSLRVLNMSHNGFTGQIPSSFKNLETLESLDLSQNNLSGNIPLQLSELTFLEVLDLSKNQLIGSIPHAKQFLTFTNESFQGNPGLCGPPLSKACENSNDAPPSSSEDTELFSESECSWKMIAVGFGSGYGVGVGAFCWTLVSWTRGRRAYNNLCTGH